MVLKNISPGCGVRASLMLYLFKILVHYANFNLVCSVGTCIADVLILDKHRYAFCHLENSGRLFIVKPRANTPSMIGVFGW